VSTPTKTGPAKPASCRDVLPAHPVADLFPDRADQIDTVECTTESIMRTADFAAGVSDVRAGRPPRFDEFYDAWSYERGRLWATLAPMSMPLRIGHKLNPKAVALFCRHEDDIL
jgi:hypothetical protein